jgi:hypothetical protein
MNILRRYNVKQLLIARIIALCRVFGSAVFSPLYPLPARCGVIIQSMQANFV